MTTTNTGYHQLIEKLDAFIRKFYKNQLIRGAIYSFTIMLLFYLIVTVGEYFAHFSTTVRTTLFYLFIGSNVYVLGRFIVIPLLHLYRFGKIISYEQASNIIGSHFGAVKDKLLNTLELSRMENAEENPAALELINASINQKMKELKPVPFTGAIDLSQNKKYLKFAVVPFSVLLFIVFVAPGIISEGTARLIDHSTYFAKPAPFEFEIQNKELKTVQQQDFRLDVKLKGKEIPEVIYIEMDGHQTRLEKENTVTFHYDFRNVQKNMPFRLVGDDFKSKDYELLSIPNPMVLNFDIGLEYPAYLGKTAEHLQNTGDLNIPAGTKVSWNFTTKNTKDLVLTFRDTSLGLHQSADNQFAYSRKFFESNSYAVSTSNAQIHSKDSILYSLSVIPDLYPSVAVEQDHDSLSPKKYMFKGQIKDDYGFTRLSFNYKFTRTDDSLKGDKDKIISEEINIHKNLTQDRFFYYWDFANLTINPGDEVEYYFEVYDNDGVVGPKASRTSTFVYKAPTIRELEKASDQKGNEIKKDLKETIKEAVDIQKEMDNLHKDLLNKKNMTWEDKKKIEDILKRQNDLEQKVSDIQKENQQKNSLETEQNKELNKELQDKQQQINDLMDKLMTPELKKLMDELAKLLDKQDKAKIQEMLDKMKFSNEDIKKEMDRTLELFKKMEMEKKMQDAIDDLKKLADKQEKEAEKTQDKNSDEKEQKDKQQELKKEFDDIKKDLKDAEEKNKELTEPEKLEDTKEDQKDIDQDQKDSEQKLDSKDKKGAAKSQKSAGQKMKKMAEKMQAAMDANSAEQQEEDAAALRQLLENLIRLSFNQEDLMEQLKMVDTNNPQYLKIGKDQQKLKDDAKMIEDSLFALSKRVTQISSYVNKETSAINRNMEKTLSSLEDRKMADARGSQQYVMTSVNNLALLLSEALKQMQEQMSQKQGNGSCNKPGKGQKPSAGSIRKMQEALNKKIQEMKDGMKPGQMGKPGEGMSEQLAKLAAQQAAIRGELNKLNQSDNKDGKKPLGDLGKLAAQMEQTEKDLVNKRLSQETMVRQQEIMSRLLESERAERERDQDNKRESKEGKNVSDRNPFDMEEYKRLKQKELELLKTLPPSLSPFYRKKVDDYFQSIPN